VISGQYVTVAPGWLHTCGITIADELYCWGSNGQGQLGTGVHEPPYLYPHPLAVNSTATFKDVDAGWYSTCAVSSSNQVYCWGLNQAGQLGQGFVSGSFEPWPDPLPVMTLNSTQ
jgi:alpha-tubulin suppressor-like RCC1 family protein